MDEEWNGLYCIDKSKSGEDLIVEELSRLGNTPFRYLFFAR